MSEKSLPRPPVTNPETEPFWQAAASGQLLIGHCDSCQAHHYYPRHHCPSCGSNAVDWRPASGTGAIYSFVDVARGPNGPFTIAYVELAEGVRMISHIVDADPAALAIGTPVELRFAPSDGGAPYPVFTPA